MPHPKPPTFPLWNHPPSSVRCLSNLSPSSVRYRGCRAACIACSPQQGLQCLLRRRSASIIYLHQALVVLVPTHHEQLHGEDTKNKLGRSTRLHGVACDVTSLAASPPFFSAHLLAGRDKEMWWCVPDCGPACRGRIRVLCFWKVINIKPHCTVYTVVCFFVT